MARRVQVELAVALAVAAASVGAALLGAGRPWTWTLAALAGGAAGATMALRRPGPPALHPAGSTGSGHGKKTGPLEGTGLEGTGPQGAGRLEPPEPGGDPLWVPPEGRHRDAALANTSDAVIILDSSGFVEYANPTARLLLADRSLEVTRRLSQPELDDLVRRVRARGEALAENLTLWVPGPHPARARAVPLADGAVIVLLHDLSEAYRLDRVRRDFVANVSHELKTPVASVRALAEMAATALSAGDLSTATRFVERLGTEASRLAGLVADLLDLSRVEAGGELHRTRLELASVLEEAADAARPVADAKGLEIRVRPTTAVVSADRAQIAMAVKNLVDNAVRYSDRGTVELAAVSAGDNVEISVTDEGIGIPAEELGRIFERFYRVDKARSRATGGTGLGLAIVRHVAENHGGRVEVRSELGAGSTFTMVLPGPTERAGAA